MKKLISTLAFLLVGNVVFVGFGYAAEDAAEEGQDAETIQRDLWYAVKKDHNNSAKSAVNLGADPFDVDRYGRTLLHEAAKYDSFRVLKSMKVLLDIYLNKVSSAGMTPLLEAAMSEGEHVLQLLVLHGADVTATDPDGNTALHYVAADAKEWMKIKVLNLYGNSSWDLNAIGSLGQTPLHLAVLNGNPDAVRELIKHGARVDIRDQSGKTVLDYLKTIDLQSFPYADAYEIAEPFIDKGYVKEEEVDI